MIKQKLKNFENNGFIIIPKAVTPKSINCIHKDLGSLAKFYSKKINLKINNKNTVPEIFSSIEEKNASIFYELCSVIGDLASMNAIQFSELGSDLINEIYNSYNNPLSVTHSGLFFNKKKVQRLKYKWHQESSYFPQHKIGFHIWYPLFNDVKKTGGPMLLKKSSHKNNYNYKMWSVKNGVTQLEINNKYIDKYETVECNVKVGDVVIFDHKLVHCTKEVVNNSIPRVAGIRRFVGNQSSRMIPCSIRLNLKANSKKTNLIKKKSK